MIDDVIRFWESILEDKGLLRPSTITFIELTLKFLRRLKVMEAEGE